MYSIWSISSIRLTSTFPTARSSIRLFSKGNSEPEHETIKANTYKLLHWWGYSTIRVERENPLCKAAHFASLELYQLSYNSLESWGKYLCRAWTDTSGKNRTLWLMLLDLSLTLLENQGVCGNDGEGKKMCELSYWVYRLESVVMMKKKKRCVKHQAGCTG